MNTWTATEVPENATCDVMGKHITTLDGQEINFDMCNHFALKDLENGTFDVIVHKDCDYTRDCKHWLQVHHEGHEVKVMSDLQVEFDGHSYTASQLVLLSRKHSVNVTVEKVGDQIVIKSLTKGFTVVYDIRAHLKIEVSPSLLRKVAGICGFYSGILEDDQQKPNGRKAFTSQDFGESWAANQEAKSCAPVICPREVMVKALEQCNMLKEEPFTKCSEILPVDQFIEICMSSMCECLQSQKKSSEEKCKCDGFQPFVEACESKLGPLAVRNWRLKHECVPDCPLGMEWNDCGPSCQLTCDSTTMTSLAECSGNCVAGCFCPPATILNEDICIPPDHCADKVCQGFGDPHFETFDGFFFPFQATGSFLISADKEKSFIVEGLTQKCRIISAITCLVGLEITYKGQQVRIRKGAQLKLDGEPISMDMLPLHTGEMVILGYPGRTFVVVIPQLSMEARYYEENSGFAVKVPSRRFFNRTVGLCGNCNAKKDDELKDGPVSEFVCSWLTTGDKEECKESFDDLPALVEPVEICEKLKNKIFQQCHPLVDPNIYVDACSFDATHSDDEKASFCKTAMEYGRQCCQAGITINDWPKEFGCDTGCPEYLQYDQCHNGCPQTCQNVKNSLNDSSCERIKVDGCFCPEGKVVKDDTCVDTIFCESCDAEGHTPGDAWKEGSCKKCYCKENLSKECTVEVCPALPICLADETLSKLKSEDELSCCETFICVHVPEKGCPTAEVPRCPEGEAVKIEVSENECPKYKCECDTALCAPAIWPKDLETGQTAEIVYRDCCPAIQVMCIVDSCPEKPDCALGLELISFEEECCTIYKCKPPEDVCIYMHLFEIVNEFQVPIDSDKVEPTTYKSGDEWKDGLCENCSCVDSQGQLVPHCVKEQCPILENMPENKDYELHELKTPGKCCPEIFKVMCKDEHGKTYEPEEEWQDEDNPCITYICEQTLSGDVQKVKSVINCTKCSRASEYIPPSKRLGQCCGICRPSKCEEDENLYEVGETWTPPGDPCQIGECVREWSNVKTVYTRQACPVLPEGCPKDKIVQDETGCCEICNITSEIHCSSVPIPIEETVGFFTFKDFQRGGICVNEKPIPELLQCSGACHSQSYYSLEDGDFKSMCMCCKVNITVNRTIELRCPDGKLIRKKFLQPETCQCSKCAPKTESTPWVRPERVQQQPNGFNFQQEESNQDEFEQQPVDFQSFNQKQQSFSPFQQQQGDYEDF